MRVIKFRVWDGKNINVLESLKEMANHILQIGTDGFWLYSFETGTLISSTETGGIIMQFTGFKDKNGKEIYEGDILGCWEDVDGKRVQSRMQVFFDEKLSQWMLDCSSEQDKSTSYALFKEIEDFEYEIIGNIYE